MRNVRYRCDLRNLVRYFGSQDNLAKQCGISQTQISQGLSYKSMTEKLYLKVKEVADIYKIKIECEYEQEKFVPRDFNDFINEFGNMRGMLRPFPNPLKQWYEHTSDSMMQFNLLYR